MTDPDIRGSGGWVPPPQPPPPPPELALATAFTAASAGALFLHACDLGAILGAIAFLFALMGSFGLAFARTTDPEQRPPGGWVPPPKIAMLSATGGAGALLASLIAVLLERCPWALWLVLIALLLLLLSLFLGRSRQDVRR